MVEILREHVACSHSRIMESSITVVQIRTATSCGVLLREIMTPTKNGVTAKVAITHTAGTEMELVASSLLFITI